MFGIPNKIGRVNPDSFRQAIIVGCCCFCALRGSDLWGKTVHSRPGLLLADSDFNTRKLLSPLAEELGCKLFEADTGESVLSAVADNDIAVLMIDTRTISESLALVKVVRKNSARIEVILMAEQATIPAAVQAIKAGATDYLEKPLDRTSLEHSLAAALERHRNFQPAVSTLDDLEKQAIENALTQAGGDRLEAARLLSIGKTTLYRKLREYGSKSRRYTKRVSP